MASTFGTLLSSQGTDAHPSRPSQPVRRQPLKLSGTASRSQTPLLPLPTSRRDRSRRRSVEPVQVGVFGPRGPACEVFLAVRSSLAGRETTLRGAGHRCKSGAVGPRARLVARRAHGCRGTWGLRRVPALAGALAAASPARWPAQRRSSSGSWARGRSGTLS